MNQNQSPSVEERAKSPVRRGFAITAIGIFLSILILPMLAWGILKLTPNGTAAFEVELEENRKLFEMPEEIDPAKLTVYLESYFNDRIPFRTLLISSYQELTASIERPYRDTLRPLMIQLLYPSDDPTPPNQNPNGDLILGTDTEETTDPTEPVPDSIVEVEGDASCAHQFDAGTVLLEATCASDGWGEIRKTCTQCGRACKEFTPKKEHQLEQISQIKATCVKDGKTTYQCSACEETVEKTEKAGHVSGHVLATVPPSCQDYGYTLHICRRCFGEFRTDVVDKLYDLSKLPLSYLSAGNGYAAPVEGKQKWLFYSGDNTLDYYQKTNPYTDAQLEEYATLLKELQTLCDTQGKELRLMIMPLRERVYAEYMPSIAVNAGSGRVEKTVKYLKEQTGLEIVYPYEELVAAKPYWQVYYRLDTHWSAAGGFIGAQALCRSLGMETVTMYNLPIIETVADRNSKYDLVWRSGSDEAYYGDDKDYSITYRQEVRTRDEWIDPGVDLAEPYDDIRIIRSDSDNDCNFVMIADSYRLNMEPFLEKDFSKCLFTHRRRVNEPMVRNSILESDVLVIAAAERLDNEIWDTVRQIIQILKQNPS
ncbi:MAG: hypothetical protein IJX62_01150 [Clostridia bacterium]|nr:hypothetical protein [Clostridia bacterium]